MKQARHWLLCILIALLPATTFPATYDLIIRHGRVIDGTGNPAFFADVGIKDGRITGIGKLTGDATRELDATNLVVAPGFIDVHTHAEDIVDLPRAENFVRMGVTTLVLGNCGSSERNIGEFFGKVEATKVSVNIATLIGHGTVRKRAMNGSFDREPTEAELREMKEMVDQAMKDGAVGLSTGLIYLPGTFSRPEEIIELARIAARYDGIYATHMRNEGNQIFKSLDETFRIAREAGIRAEISHIKLSGKPNWGQAQKVIDQIEAARTSGLDITEDEYVYTASSTGLSQLIPDSFREGGRFRERLADSKQKAQMVSAMKATLANGKRKDYSYAVIANYKDDKSLNGLNVVEAARKKFGSASLNNQIELILEIEKHGGASAVFHGMDEADLQSFLRHPNTMIASDSGVRKFDEGVPHPRGYGNNARVLGRYVRELKLLRLEEGIRRMTSLPAQTFRLKDRGQLREGAAADLVIFNPATIRDNATFEKPHQYATGFEWVLVNGEVVVEKDHHTGAKPGQALRHHP